MCVCIGIWIYIYIYLASSAAFALASNIDTTHDSWIGDMTCKPFKCVLSAKSEKAEPASVQNCVEHQHHNGSLDMSHVSCT